MGMSSDSKAVPQGKTINVKTAIPWIIYIIFFGVLNETVFNVSTPSIAAQYGLLPSGVAWVITSFVITFGIGSVIYGKLSDTYSLKKLIIIGILIYNAGSLIGISLQAYYPAVIAARAIQGAGAAAIPALIMVIIARYFAPEARGKVFGILTSTVAFSIGVGPVIGGFVSGTLHWSLLFLIPLASLAAIPYFSRELPDETTGGGRIDIAGAALLSVGLAATVLFLTESNGIAGMIGVVAIVWFILHIRRVKDPFIDPSLLRNLKYRTGIIVGFLLFCAVMGIMFIVPLMLTALYGLSTVTIGWIMFPGAISAVVSGTLGGNLADKRGNPIVMYAGSACLIISMLLLAILLGLNPWLLAGALLPMYIGFSFIQTSLANTISQTLSMEQTGVGMGLFNLVGFISAAVGTAVVSRALDWSVLQFTTVGFTNEPAHAVYPNLMLIFAAIFLLCAVMYMRVFGGSRAVPLPAKS